MAFASIDRDVLAAVAAHELGNDSMPFLERLPAVADGISTMHLIDAAVRSHDDGGRAKGLIDEGQHSD